MNELFVNIKVDREERPDVDQLYMTAVQVMTRHGGWPMSVWLTPDLKPFYAGTYFPPEDMHGRPGFPRLLEALAEAWRERKDDVRTQADEMARVLQQMSDPPRPKEALSIDETFIESIVRRSIEDFDPAHGGYGGAPKFPRQTLLEFLLKFCEGEPPHDRDGLELRRTVRDQLVETLDAMARGGIRDHLGGGVHRYSTDREWLVPHFEIMLYDQAMLALVYAEAYRLFEVPRFARVAREMCDFVLREMTDREGAFYTAFDAEVDAREGGSYLWTAEQVRAVLGDAEGQVFNDVYGLSAGPNFADPHHGTGKPDANVLFLKEWPDEETDARLAPLRQKLLKHRATRKQPLLDTKIITSWNALMIRALGRVGQVLQEDRYMQAAMRAANYILVRHRSADGAILRTSREGQAKHVGTLEDVALLAQACLALHESEGNVEWKQHAASLAMEMIQHFGAEERRGFYWTSASADDLIVRQRTATDTPLPAGAAVAAMVFQLLDLPKWSQGTIETFAAQMNHYGEGMSAMMQAALQYIRQHGAIEVMPRAESDIGAIPPVIDVDARWTGEREAELLVTIADGYHINGPDVASPLVPTRVQLVEPGHAAEVTLPPAASTRLPHSDEPLDVYSGTVRIRVQFEQRPSDGVTFAVRCQPCDDHSCLAPVRIEARLEP